MTAIRLSLGGASGVGAAAAGAAPAAGDSITGAVTTTPSETGPGLSPLVASIVTLPVVLRSGSDPLLGLVSMIGNAVRACWLWVAFCATGVIDRASGYAVSR